MGNVGNVDAAAGDVSRNQDGNSSLLEGTPSFLLVNNSRVKGEVKDLHGVFALKLRTLAVDEDSRQGARIEVVVNLLDTRNTVNEDESATCLFSIEQVDQGIHLGFTVDEDDVLSDILVGGASTTDTDAKVVLRHVLTGELATALGEGSREHHEQVVGVGIGICGHGQHVSGFIHRGLRLTPAIHDLFQLLRPVVVEHLVSLIDDAVPRPCVSGEVVKSMIVSLLDSAHGENVGPVHEIAEATG